MPSDFDILRPSRSIRKPWVSTSRNGGRPRVASATSSELWNQPRCWSLPSRYMSDGQARSGVARQHGLVARARVEPDVEDVALALERRRRRTTGTSARRARTPRSAARTRRRRCTARRPPAARSTSAGVSTASPQVVQSSAGIGTPHARWREMHQSGRFDDHVEDAVAAPGGNPLHLMVDGVARGLAQRARLRRPRM